MSQRFDPTHCHQVLAIIGSSSSVGSLPTQCFSARGSSLENLSQWFQFFDNVILQYNRVYLGNPTDICSYHFTSPNKTRVNGFASITLSLHLAYAKYANTKSQVKGQYYVHKICYTHEWVGINRHCWAVKSNMLGEMLAFDMIRFFDRSNIAVANVMTPKCVCCIPYTLKCIILNNLTSLYSIRNNKYIVENVNIEKLRLMLLVIHQS